VSLNTGLMFGKASDEWRTPREFFDALNDEFHFVLDAAATDANALAPHYLTADVNALTMSWCYGGAVWLNPPYSKARQFFAKAAQEARDGATVVCLPPARTDTQWWHAHVYDAATHAYRPGVSVRFVKGRLKFLGPDGHPIVDKNGHPVGAPFPSVVVIFRPV